MSAPSPITKGPDDGNPGTFGTNYGVSAVNLAVMIYLAVVVGLARRRSQSHNQWAFVMLMLVFAVDTLSFLSAAFLHEWFYTPHTTPYRILERVSWGSQVLHGGLLLVLLGLLLPARRRDAGGVANAYCLSPKKWRTVMLVAGLSASAPTLVFLLVWPSFHVAVFAEGVALGIFALGLVVRAVLEPSGRRATLTALLAVVLRIGAGFFQFAFESTCGVDDPVHCPFPYEFNHNAIFHVFVALADALWCYPGRDWSLRLRTPTPKDAFESAPFLTSQRTINP